MNNLKKFKRIKLVKKGIGFTIVASTLLISGCGNSALNNYYVVTDNGHNYICTKEEFESNMHDLEFYDIKDNKNIGVLCSKHSGNFDYSIHHISTNFLSELQIFDLSNSLLNEGVDLSIFKNESDIKKLSNDKILSELVYDHFSKIKYHIEEKFKYALKSKLQLFVNENDVIIGYDLSPDREINRYRYIYSIEDFDVVEFASDDVVKPINIGIYLTDEQKRKGYINYDDAIDMVTMYKKNYYQKIKKIS